MSEVVNEIGDEINYSGCLMLTLLAFNTALLHEEAEQNAGDC